MPPVAHDATMLSLRYILRYITLAMDIHIPPESLLLILATGIFVVAILYSSVGHAGASGYIAVMSLLSLAPAVIRPTALALNILVASIAT